MYVGTFVYRPAGIVPFFCSHRDGARVRSLDSELDLESEDEVRRNLELNYYGGYFKALLRLGW
jgi:hypothetical protein